MEVVDIDEWASPEIKTISLTQDIWDLSYELRVREFIPRDGDVLHRTWISWGKKQKYRCSPYAIASMGDAGRTFNNFLDQGMEKVIEHYMESTDPLLSKTYYTAYEHSKSAETDIERTLLRHCLRLWTGIRCCSRSDYINGPETLGMEPQAWGGEYNSGRIVIPPMIYAQLELVITVAVLRPLSRSVCRQLQTLVQKNEPRYWFTIYLCMCVLLHSCALFTAFEHGQARKYGHQARYMEASWIKELHFGARILLAHFHYCNKGSHPLSREQAGTANVASAHLSVEQSKFLQETRRLYREKEPAINRVRKNRDFEDDFFFVSQLFDEDWTPTTTI
jgi:hypothetical protein